MTGGGRYGDLCEGTLIQAKADGVVLLVLGGVHGNGFSIAAKVGEDRNVLVQLPEILRDVAASIEKDIADGVGGGQ